MINTLSLLSGTSLYYLIIHRFEVALAVGIASAVYGNFYGAYIVKRAKKELPTMLMSMFVQPEDREKTLNILKEMK